MTLRPRTLALGAPDSDFFRSISHLLPHFGAVDFAHERDFASPSELEAEVSQHYDRVLMPNPYGNRQRLRLYRRLRQQGVPIIAADRGALPRSWFFDGGFNADSPSYAPDLWDLPLSDEERDETREYIRRLRESSDALEAQGPRRSPTELRNQLGISDDEHILFVPLQRPSDTVVQHFAGPVSGMDGFLDFVSAVTDLLEARAPGRWRVVLKKHPLEPLQPASHQQSSFAPNDCHVHDLLEVADAVLVLNSGVGLLSLCFGKTTVHVGDAFYGQQGLARRARRPEEAVEIVVEGQTPSREKVLRFVHHLRHHVYSFGDAETELRVDASGTHRRITKHLELSELRILGEHIQLGQERVVVVSPVIPAGLSRGSQARVCEMLRALDRAGLRVSLAVLNVRSTQSTTGIERAIREEHPYLEHLIVHQHPRLDATLRGRFRQLGLRLADRATLASQRITSMETCPPAFRRAVEAMVERAKPRFLLINYAKMAPCKPRWFEGISVVDTHDIQSNRLADDQEQNGVSRGVHRWLFQLSERLALRGFDRLIAINPEEQQALRALLPQKPVHFVPAFVKAPRLGPADGTPARDVLFVASKSSFNVTGLEWFVERVIPLIVKDWPTFQLTVVGSISEVEHLSVRESPFVSFRGVVPDLGPVYAQSACVIAPVLGGAGMKIKVVDALAHGKAIVATPRALDGIRAVDGEHLRIATSPEAFAQAVVEVIANPHERASLERGARALHARDHSPEAVMRAVERVFEMPG